MSRTRLPILLALAAGAAVLAEPGAPPDMNLFGDGIVRKLKREQRDPLNGVRMIINDKAVRFPAKPGGETHLLVFHDGRQLRGEIVALTQDEVAWRRAGVSESLRLARADVQSIVLSPPVEGRNDLPQIPGLEPLDSSSQAKLAAATAGTLKLGGGDWLFGDVTSADGGTFNCRLDAGATFTIPRGQIEWLYGGAPPAPAFTLSAARPGTTGWRSPGGAASVEAADGTMTVRDAAWFGRTARLPARFEVTFELPADAEEGTRLWLQPYGLQPNSYSTGTIMLRFAPLQLARRISLNGFAQKTVRIAKSAAVAPVSYRVLYDGEDARLVVQRNGELLGDWKFSDEHRNGKTISPRGYVITGICFDHDDQDQKRDLKFNRLEIRPWNGLIPKEGEPAPGGDMLSVGREPPREGKLESLSEKDFAFSGTTLTRAAGLFVQFPQRPAALANATATLNFGTQGELSVADLEIHDGQARCRTAFAPAFAAPVATLKTIAFSSHAGAPMTGDVLVFKNGDELPGVLLSAAPNSPLRWRTARGQEVEVEAAQAAGVRFAATRKAPPAKNRATVELRNGDRLRGEFDELDGTHLRLRHTQLGAVSIERSRVWRLYPNPRFAVSDGTCDRDTWFGKGPPGEAAALLEDEDETTLVPWLCLDGRYALRAHPSADAGWATAMLHSTAGSAFERFELRFDITRAGEDQPSFSLQFTDQSRDLSVQTSLSDGEFRIFSVNQRAQNAINQREVTLTDKLVDPTTRLNVRAFVDRKAGVIDFFVDGVAIAKTGHQKAERMPGIGAHMVLQAHANDGAAVVVSNLWIGPWNGELPRAGTDANAMIALANGDVAAGTPTVSRDGKFAFESDIGLLDLPLATVQSIEFGGALAPEPAMARVSLPDGGSLNVDTFRWDGRELTAHSATAGDLHLSAEAVSELVFDPPPVQAPRTPPPKKLAQKSEEPNGP